MCFRILSLYLVAFFLLSAAPETTFSDAKGSTAKKREKSDLGTKDFSGESQFTGDVAFSIPVASKGGVDVTLRYSSNIHKLIPADNRFSSPGWVGLGWKLNLGCIQADNNNTRDPSDDKYFFVGPDVTSELIVDTLNAFMLREYRHWKITREVSSETVIGWTVILEDGTICRYGNYDKSTAAFTLDSLPTHATRSFVACDNIIQTTLATNGSPSLVPYQWDLSDIQDVNGDHTVIKWQQVKQSLSGTSLLSTIESYPKEIVDRQGRKVEFVLFSNPLIYLDSPLIGTGQIKRETRTLKHVLTKDARGNVVSGMELQYDTINVLNRTSQLNKKVFLKKLIDLDMTLNPVRSTLFEYAGVSALLDTGDHNPGALKKLTLPEGGTISYKYCNDVVITDRSPTIASQGQFGSSFGYGRLATDMNYWSMSGSDFLVVWRAGLLQAYRWGPGNRIELDGSFPLSSVTSSTTSAYWVQNDYVVCKYGTSLVVAKRSGEGWKKTVIESTTSPATLELLGLGADYFVYATSCSYSGQTPLQGDMKVATYSNSGTWSVDSLSRVAISSPNRIICGTRVFASGGNLPVYMYNPSTSSWENTGNAMNYSSAGLDCLLRQSSDTEYQIWKWTGSAWSATYLQGPPYPNVPGASLIPGNNFFLIYSSTQLFVATNTPGGWSAISWVNLLPDAVMDQYSRVAVGPDFFAISWRVPSQNLWKVGVVRYKNGQWQSGSVMAQLPARTVDQYNYEQCTPVVSGSTLFTEIYEGYNKLQLHSFVFQNETWDSQQLVNLDLGWNNGYQNPLKPFMQPGANFTACIIDSNLQRYGDGTLLAWKRSYGTNFREVYSDTASGGVCFRVAAKTTADGMGNSSSTSIQLSNGSFDDDIASVRFNKYTAIPPGTNGKTVSYSYNDMGPGLVEEFRSNQDFRYLDGQQYLTRTYDKDGTVVSETTNDYLVTLPGSTTQNASLIPIETYTAGTWATVPGGEIHAVIDDGATLDPNDYAWTNTNGDAFVVKLSSPDGSFAPGSDLQVTADALSSVPDEPSTFHLVLWEHTGSGLQYVADAVKTAPPNTGWTAFTITVPSSYVVDPSRLYVGVELDNSPMQVARVKCDFQVRTDRGVSYARLVQSSATRDGVPVVTTQEYNATNGLVKKITETSSTGVQRITETIYAYERSSYSDMGSLMHMYSQVYSTTLENGSTDVEAKKWTVWGNADGVWRPREEWVWKGDGSANDQSAPDDPESSSEALKVSSIVAYDTHGNPRQITDADGVHTTTVYGYDSTLSVGTFKNATTASAFATVFDDSVLTGWTPSSGSWGIQNGVYKQNDGVATGSWFTPTKNTLVQIDDAVIEADIRFDNLGNYRYIAIAKVVDQTSYLRFECRKSENIARIHAYAPGTEVYQSQSFTFSENRWYHLRGEIQGETASFYIDGKKIVELVAAAVDRPAGYVGLCTHGTVASFDNIRFHALGALAAIQVYDRRSNATTGVSDENGVLQSTLYDSFNRWSKLLLRADGRNALTGELRYAYSRAVGDVYEKARPNAVEVFSPAVAIAYSDFTNSDGWAVGGTDVLFGCAMAGETTVRLGTDGGWNYIVRSAPSTHTIVRVDFYPSDTTDGTPHVLAFESTGYRFCVQYNPSTDRFQMQTYFGSSWNNPMTFDLPAPPNRWYTIELEKTEGGEAYAFVFPKGEGRINKTGYVYRTSGYPASWAAQIFSYSNTDYFYLANFHAGLPDRAMALFDGLGRDLQTQRQLKLSTIVESSTQYDSAGRAYRAFKPYEKDYTDVNRHRFDSLYTTNADAYYNAMDCDDSHTSGYPFAETKYNPDPLARAWKQAFPGYDWRMSSGHETQTTFGPNGGYDLPGYGPNVLFKTSSVDEDANTSWSFVDKFGNNVASIVDPAGLNLRTTMQYDVLGNRTASVTPRGDTTKYVYNPIKQLQSKTSPDQGTTQYLYDKNGNIRLVKDAAHTGTGANSVYFNSNNVTAPSSYSDQFTLTMPGNVNIEARVYEIDWYEVLYVRIKANGTTIKTVQTSAWAGANGSIILPKGTYTFEVQAMGDYGYFGYTISCQTGYEFIYYKYDLFNRLIEAGEYESNSASGNFTQSNAETGSFPSSNCLQSSVMTYDTGSSDENAAGQRNLKGRLSMARSYRLGTPELTTSYSYNPFGLVEWTVQTNSASRVWQQKQEYDVQGRVTMKSFLDGSSANYNLYTFYEYDQMGRLAKVSTGPNADGSSKIQEAAYTYYAGGAAKRTQLATVQGVDYRYNTRDWLKQINHQNLSAGDDPGHDGPGGSGLAYADKLGMVLGYQVAGHIGDPGNQNATPRWNGNISWAIYNMAGVTFAPGSPYSPTTMVGSTYACDNASRITSSNFGFFTYHSGLEDWGWFGTNSYDETGYQYDGSGNITAVQRYGNTGALMDNLTYTYATGTNRLRHIGDAVAAGTFSTDIDNQVSDNYAYDGNGSLQKDLQRDVAFAVNDIHNLPVSVWKASTGQELKYYYDTEGKRIRKDAGSTEYYLNGPGGETEVVVKSDESGATHSILGRDDLGQVKRAGGSFARYYYLKDHLGSIKITVDASCNTTGYDDYYPFGQQMDGRCYTSSADARYKYTSKERDAESGYDYFGARYYDSRIGRFASVDRFAAKYPSFGSYNCAGNNPLRFVDVNGDSVWIVDNGQRHLYAQNMSTKGLTESAIAIINALNNVGGYVSGSYVLGNLMESTKSFSLNSAGSKLTRERAAGETEATMKGGSNVIFAEGGISNETVAHELFHSWEIYKGASQYSLLSEVQASLFAGAVANRERFGLEGPWLQPAISFQEAMTCLLKDFNRNDLQSAINTFKVGSIYNTRSVYNDMEQMTITPTTRVVIESIYPLLKRR